MAFNWFRKKKKKKPIVDDSVILPSAKLLKKLLETWPDMNPGRLWPEDRSYVMPTRKELEEFVFKSKVDDYEYVPEIQDCGDFALFLHVDVIRERFKDYKDGKISKDQQYPWAFGQLWHQDSQIGYHAINICITKDEGVLLIEPQTDKIRKATRDMTIYFVRF
jgi:hypothetical protein